MFKYDKNKLLINTSEFEPLLYLIITKNDDMELAIDFIIIIIP